MDDADELTLPHRTEWCSVPTEKMLAYQQDELTKREKRLLSLYDHWKTQIRTFKENLKKDISEMELAKMADVIERGINDIMKESEQHHPLN